VAAVRSLYKDALKPYGRLILKRVRERAAEEYGVNEDDESPSGVPRVDPRLLRRIALNTPGMQVEPEDGKEYSVHLVKMPANFVDVSSAEDPYPEELWCQVAEYFETLSCEDMILPGGRYACAKLLASRRPEFVEGRSLGEICHIIQLAISQRRILGYANGHIVPYGESEERVKEECAVLQQPVSSPKQRGWTLPHATWEQARLGLIEILHSASSSAAVAQLQQGSQDQPCGVVTLSNVKRLFRSRFRLELSETVLGYPRLLDLLQDYRFRDICVVRPHSNGQVIVHAVTADSHVLATQVAPPTCASRTRSGSETPDSMASVSTPTSVGTACEAGAATPTSLGSPSIGGGWSPTRRGSVAATSSGSASPVRRCASGRPVVSPLPSFEGKKTSDLVCLSTFPMPHQQPPPPPVPAQHQMAKPAALSPPTPPPLTPAPTLVPPAATAAAVAPPPPPTSSAPADVGVLPRPPAGAAATAGPARWEFVAVPTADAAPTVFPEEAHFDSSGCSTPRAEPGLPEHLCQAEALQRVAAVLEQWRSRGQSVSAS